MTAQEILHELRALSDERMLDSWNRMGIDTSNYYGVNYSRLRRFAELLDRNHVLAQELWGTGVHDARLLATLIEEPLKVPTGQLDRWLLESGFLDLADKIVQNVAARTLYAKDKMREWLKSRKEYIRRAGYVLMAELIKTRKFPADDELEDVLATIERTFRKERDWVKEAMNRAVIAIGLGRPTLRNKAMATAKRIGKVVIDQGYSSSRVPDAVKRLSMGHHGRGRPPMVNTEAKVRRAAGKSKVRRPRGRPKGS